MLRLINWLRRILSVAALNTRIVLQNSPYGNTILSLSNIPCDSQTLLQSVLKALIHLWTREYTLYAAPPLWSPQRNSMNSCLADRETRLWTRGGGCGGVLYITETANTQTDLIPGSAVSQQLSLHAIHIPSWCSTLTRMSPLLTYTYTKSQFGSWMATENGKYHNQFKKCWMSKVEEEEGQEAGSLCDPLVQWKRVQWKIVPTANPWQANYSFDPLGVYITIGGREATHSGAQYGCSYICFGLQLS